jgi:hypothetical protein
MPTRQDARRWCARLTRSIDLRDGTEPRATELLMQAAEQNCDIEAATEQFERATLGEPLALAAIRPITSARTSRPGAAARSFFVAWFEFGLRSCCAARSRRQWMVWWTMEHTSACRSLREGQPSWLFAVEE